MTISSPTAVAPRGGLLIKVGDQPIQLSFSRAISNSERPFWYEVQVSRDTAFADVAHLADEVASSGASADAYELTAMLDPEQMYYWRVRALDGANTGPYSATAVFQVFTPLVVGQPMPMAPVGGAMTATRRATLVLDNASIAGPTTSVVYRFEVSTDPGFGGVVASLTVPAGGATTTATTGDLAWETHTTGGAARSPRERKGRCVAPGRTRRRSGLPRSRSRSACRRLCRRSTARPRRRTRRRSRSRTVW